MVAEYMIDMKYEADGAQPELRMLQERRNVYDRMFEFVQVHEDYFLGCWYVCTLTSDC